MTTKRLLKREKINFLSDYYSYLRVGFTEKEIWMLCAKHLLIAGSKEPLEKLIILNMTAIQKHIDADKILFTPRYMKLS